MAKWAGVLSILALAYACDAYKILVVSPLHGKSHAILGEGLVRHLANAGHEITYVTALLPDKPRPNVKVIQLKNNAMVAKAEKMFNLKDFLNSKGSLIDIVTMLSTMGEVSTEVITDENFMKLMKDKTQQFDVVIAEWLYSDVYSAFGPIFDCPFIWFSSVEPHWKILKLIDEATNPSYTSDILSSSSPPFSFTQRIAELGLQVMGHILDMIFFDGPGEANYYKYLAPIIQNKGRAVPDYETMKYNASLVIGNSHVSLGVPSKLPDSYKSIGGYHIEKDVKPLPENLKKIFDEAKDGVIYFSMGSNLKSKSLPDELKRDLLAMFGKVKQTVLWKFEEELPNRPANVHILKWAPQQSILAHEKCRLFITHGGLLSTTEAIHFGVPTIGIPVFADQFVNVERAKKKGFARRVDLSYTMADSLLKEINEVISNPIYRQKVKELSLIYHDRTVPPSKELVHWVEHVVKTRGAPHLRSPALMVTWYQKIFLDFAALVLVILVVVIFSIKYLIKKASKKKMNSPKKFN